MSTTDRYPYEANDKKLAELMESVIQGICFVVRICQRVKKLVVRR